MRLILALLLVSLVASASAWLLSMRAADGPARPVPGAADGMDSAVPEGVSAAAPTRREAAAPPRDGVRTEEAAPAARAVPVWVLDDVTRQPIDGASVVAAASLTGARRAPAGGTERAARTDATGQARAAVTADDGEGFALVAWREDYLATARWVEPASEPVRIDLALVPRSAAAAIRGRVCAPGGAPLPAAQVELSGAASSRPERGLGAHEQVEVGADGAFALDALVPGRARLRVIAAGRAAHERDLELAAGARLDLGAILLELAGVAADVAGAQLTGRVTDGDGAPVVGVVVRVQPSAGATHDTGTDAGGRYRFEGLEPGRADVRLLAEGRPEVRAAVELAVAEPAVFDHRYEAGEYELRGRVVDGAVPVAGLEVIAAVQPGTGPARRLLARAETDAEGRFAVAGLTAPVVDVTMVWRHGLFRDLVVPRVRADAGDVLLRFPLPRDVVVHGAVRDVAGRPVEGAVLEPVTAALRERPGSRAVTAPDGSYELQLPLTNQQAGLLAVRKTGFLEGRLRVRLNDADASYRARVDVVLYGERDVAELTGTVRGADGHPAGAARCELRRPGEIASLVTGRTDDAGRFALTGVEPGALALVVEHAAHAAALQAVTLRPGETGEVEITLTALQTRTAVLELVGEVGPIGGVDVAQTPVQGVSIGMAVAVAVRGGRNRHHGQVVVRGFDHDVSWIDATCTCTSGAARSIDAREERSGDPDFPCNWGGGTGATSELEGATRMHVIPPFMAVTAILLMSTCGTVRR